MVGATYSVVAAVVAAVVVLVLDELDEDEELELLPETVELPVIIFTNHLPESLSSDVLQPLVFEQELTMSALVSLLFDRFQIQ